MEIKNGMSRMDNCQNGNQKWEFSKNGNCPKMGFPKMGTFPKM